MTRIAHGVVVLITLIGAGGMGALLMYAQFNEPSVWHDAAFLATTLLVLFMGSGLIFKQSLFDPEYRSPETSGNTEDSKQ